MTDPIREVLAEMRESADLEDRRQWGTDTYLSTPDVRQWADKIDAALSEAPELDVRAMEAALRDCRAYAAMKRKESWAETILRFCESAGIKSSPLRGGQQSVGLDALVGQALRGATWCNAARECELSDDECERAGCRRFADRATILARIEQQEWGGEAGAALRSDAGQRMLDEAISARLAKGSNEAGRAMLAAAPQCGREGM